MVFSVGNSQTSWAKFSCSNQRCNNQSHLFAPAVLNFEAVLGFMLGYSFAVVHLAGADRPGHPQSIQGHGCQPFNSPGLPGAARETRRGHTGVWTDCAEVKPSVKQGHIKDSGSADRAAICCIHPCGAICVYDDQPDQKLNDSGNGFILRSLFHLIITGQEDRCSCIGVGCPGLAGGR